MSSSVPGAAPVERLRYREGVGVPQDVGELQAGALLQLGQGDLEDPELVEFQGLELVEVLGQQERARLEPATFAEGEHLPVLARQPCPPVDAVVVVEDRSAEDADLQVLDVGVGEDRILQPAPDVRRGCSG